MLSCSRGPAAPHLEFRVLQWLETWRTSGPQEGTCFTGGTLSLRAWPSPREPAAASEPDSVWRTYVQRAWDSHLHKVVLDYSGGAGGGGDRPVHFDIQTPVASFISIDRWVLGTYRDISSSSHVGLYFTIVHVSMCSFIHLFKGSLCQELGIRGLVNSDVREYRPTMGV